MQSPLQITFRGIPQSDAVESRIRDKVAELERFYAGITRCRVTVDALHQRHTKGNLYSVHVDLHVPDKEIFVGRERPKHQAHEDVYVAIRDAFDAAVRQLEDYARKRRGQIKRHESPDHAEVVGLFPDEGYGFVRKPDGTEVYFHENSVKGAALAALELGDEVRIVVADGEGVKGPQASMVVPVGRQRVSGSA